MNISGVWCVSEAKFSELLLKLPHFVDETDHGFGHENGPIIIKETLAGDKQFGSLTPSNGIVRYQFLNCMIKAGCKKYKIIPSSSCSYAEAMSMFFDE